GPVVGRNGLTDQAGNEDENRHRHRPRRQGYHRATHGVKHGKTSRGAGRRVVEVSGYQVRMPRRSGRPGGSETRILPLGTGLSTEPGPAVRASQVIFLLVLASFTGRGLTSTWTDAKLVA